MVAVKYVLIVFFIFTYKKSPRDDVFCCVLATVVVLGSFAKNTNAFVMAFGHFIPTMLFHKELIQPKREF